MSSIFETLQQLNRKNEEEGKAKKVIKDLIDTGWSKDNESQMKAVQLLKGLALSDEPEANEFMKKLDKFTSSLKKEMEESKDKAMKDLMAIYKKDGSLDASDYEAVADKYDMSAASLRTMFSKMKK